MRPVRKLKFSVLYIGLAALSCKATHALEFDAEVVVSTGLESNPTYAPSSLEESEQVSKAGLIFSLRNSKDWYNLESSYGGFYEDYGDDSIADQSYGSGATDLDVEIIKNRIGVFASHSLERQLESVTALNTRDNEETINKLEGGVRLTVPAGNRIDVDLTAKTQDIRISASENASDSPPDATSNSAALTVTFSPSRRNIFYAGAQLIDSSRDGASEDQETTLAYIGYTSLLRNVEYSLQLGQNSYDFGSVSDQGLFLSGELAYEADQHSLNLSLDQQDTNTATGILSADGSRDNIGDGGVETERDSLIDSNSNSAIRITRATLNYSNNICPRCIASIGLDHERTLFEDPLDNGAPVANNANTNDREENEVVLSFNYRLAGNLSTTVSAGRKSTTIYESDLDFDEDTVNFETRWDLNTRLSLLADIFLIERKSESNEPDLRNSGVSLSLNYLFFSNSPTSTARKVRHEF